MHFYDKQFQITVGARESMLSQMQVQEVLDEIRSHIPTIEFFPLLMKTRGDKELLLSLRDMDKTNFFTKEIDDALLAGQCRIAIHSAKDLPEPLAKGLVMVALTKGVDPSDVLVLRDEDMLESLPSSARIGTSSKRREETLLAMRSDIECVDIRGSITQRLEKLDSMRVDGVVMAEAALIRLKLTHRNRVRLPGPVAALQGQLAIVAREDDEEMKAIFSQIDVREHENNTVSGDRPIVFSR